MSAVDVAKAGCRLSHARRLSQQIQPPTRIDPDFSLSDGYAVGRVASSEIASDGSISHADSPA
jgi:hypothetical protein